MSDSVRRRYTHRAQKTKRKVDQTRRVFEGARTVCYAVASYDLKLDSQVIVVMLIDILMFLGGLVALYFGAEWLVAGASSLAMRFGIAPLIVGLTVVAFGTSAPELLVSLLAVKDQADGVSVGNIIGSNIANIALILGCSALVAPISINKSALMREYPIMLSSGILLVVLAQDLMLSRVDGVILCACMVAFLVYSFVRGRKLSSMGMDVEPSDEIADPSESSSLKDTLFLSIGIAGLALGAWLLVESAVSMAKSFEVPDLVIGITIVAIGTSLPELATSVVAAYKGQSDISVGNVIGSNIFNVFLVLGVVAMIMPVNVSPLAVKVDLWVMLGVCVIIWPLMRFGLKLTRVNGVFLLIGYVAYMVYLFMRDASGGVSF